MEVLQGLGVVFFADDDGEFLTKGDFNGFAPGLIGHFTQFAECFGGGAALEVQQVLIERVQQRLLDGWEAGFERGYLRVKIVALVAQAAEFFRICGKGLTQVFADLIRSISQQAQSIGGGGFIAAFEHLDGVFQAMHVHGLLQRCVLHVLQPLFGILDAFAQTVAELGAEFAQLLELCFHLANSLCIILVQTTF